LFNFGFWSISLFLQVDDWTKARWAEFRNQINEVAANVETYIVDGILKSNARQELAEYLSPFCSDEDLPFMQIVYEGGQIAHCTIKSYREAISLEVPVHMTDDEWQFRWVRLKNGVPAYVIQRAFASSTPDSRDCYVEMGFLAAFLQISIMNQLVLAFFGTFLAPIALVILGTHLLNRRVYERLQSKTAAQASPEAIPTATTIQDPEAPFSLPVNHSISRTVALRGGTLIFFHDRRDIEVNGQIVHLTPKEHQLLSLLGSEPGRLFSEKEIIDSVWPEGNPDSPPTSKDVKQQIFFLRKKLGDDADAPSFIGTERGLGYKLLISV
jgi:DNA-binding winged helix-turn-helix (wHTH) protein